jgi:LPS sulfotransferase NodH
MSAIERSIIPFRPKRKPRNSKGLWFAARRLSFRLQGLHHWWLRAHEPYRAVFILATQRTGSSLLRSFLGQIPGVEMKGEILCKYSADGPSKSLKTARALRHLQIGLQTLRAPIRGCKLMLEHFTHHSLSVDDLNGCFADCRFIVIYRRSLAEQFISRELALATKQWALSEGQEQKQALVTIRPAALRTYCEATRQAYTNLLSPSWLVDRSVLVSYEELTADPATWLRDEICPLLDAPAIEPRINLRKQNTLPMSERVANYHEVAALLASPLCQQHYSWRGASQSRTRKAA